MPFLSTWGTMVKVLPYHIGGDTATFSAYILAWNLRHAVMERLRFSSVSPGTW